MRKTAELRGFEPLTFCMPCRTIPSDGVALDAVTLEIDDCVVVTARFSEHAAADGTGAWIVSTHLSVPNA